MLDPRVNTLLTLVEAGSFTQAAQTLNLTQPAVSHQMKSLEQEYGIRIFFRNKKQLKPTPEGEILIKYARRMLAVSLNARKAIEDSQRSIRSLSLGITPTAEESLVPQIFAAYCNQHPEVHINIITDTINNIYNRLKSYALDLAIVEGNIPDKDFTSLLLDTDYLCLAVSAKHPFAKRESVSLYELHRENFILRSPKAGTRMLFENHLLSHSEDINRFNVIMELDNVNTLKELVASNLGVTVIAHSACAEEIETGKLVVVPIENLNMVREINMVYHKDFKHAELLYEIRNIFNARRTAKG